MPRKRDLDSWVATLEREKLIDYVIASYEAVPLLAEYCPRINAQQLKHSLLSREERDRVEKLIGEHGKLSAASLNSAMSRFAACRGAKRAKLAARFLRDFLRYHRDLRRLEALNSALDSGNLIGNSKMRELPPSTARSTNFVARKTEAVRRQSPASRNSESGYPGFVEADAIALEKGMNPASYFSLNFYGPVNKSLASTARAKCLSKVMQSSSHCWSTRQPPMAVSRACVLAREMIEDRAGLQPIIRTRRITIAGAGDRNFVSGFRAHVSDGRGTADHDFRSVERK